MQRAPAVERFVVVETTRQMAVEVIACLQKVLVKVADNLYSYHATLCLQSVFQILWLSHCNLFNK